MASLTFWTRFDERTNKHYMATAQIEDKTTSVGDEVWFCGGREIVDAVRKAWIDCEQPRREVYDFDIYEIEVHDADDAEDVAYRYVAVKQNGED